MNLADIARACGKDESANMRSCYDALLRFGPKLGLDRPHRLAHYLAQVMHESGGFRHDEEIWGPTPAQERYEGRADLGNTEPGDGKRFRGRGPIQITGRGNYREFTVWAQKIDVAAPDFEKNPAAIITEPWEGLAPLWYWESRNLNALADRGALEAITRRVNGGLNGYADRRRYYARCALVMLGRKPSDVAGFQKGARLLEDGISGQLTENALHEALCALPPYQWGPPAPMSDTDRLTALERRVSALERDRA